MRKHLSSNFSQDRTRWESHRAGRMRAAPALCPKSPSKFFLSGPRGPETSDAETQVKEKGGVALPQAPPPWSLAPPTHNEQLVENLHFMKIGLKNKGVSLCCPVLPTWPIWVLSPPRG